MRSTNVQKSFASLGPYDVCAFMIVCFKLFNEMLGTMTKIFVDFVYLLHSTYYVSFICSGIRS